MSCCTILESQKQASEETNEADPLQAVEDERTRSRDFAHSLVIHSFSGLKLWTEYILGSVHANVAWSLEWTRAKTSVKVRKEEGIARIIVAWQSYLIASDPLP